MKRALVTGAYGAIGKEIVKGLARTKYNLLIVGRDKFRLNELSDEIRFLYPSCDVNLLCIDVSRKMDIDDRAANLELPIDVLINNAATAPRSRLMNDDGIEMQWATNVLAYYWMISAFMPHLRKTEHPRIVNVASYWAGGLDLKDPEFKKRKYNNDTAYRQSKQANRMMTFGLAETYYNQVSINSCHPGDVNSKLSNDLGFGGSESAKNGAETPILLATTKLGVESTGGYFDHGHKKNCRFIEDKGAVSNLMEIIRRY